MSEVRSCVYFSVIFLCFQICVAKPFFGTGFWCDFLCEDDDGSTTTASSEDYWDLWCDDCFPRRTTATPPTTPTPPTPTGAPALPYNVMLPFGTSFNLVPDPNRGGYSLMAVMPPGGPPGAAPPAAPPAAATAAPAAPAAAAATTAAADTTTAAGATTAATTAAPARK